MPWPHPDCLDGEEDSLTLDDRRGSPSPSARGGWGRDRAAFSRLAHHLVRHPGKLDGVERATPKSASEEVANFASLALRVSVNSAFSTRSLDAAFPARLVA